MGGEWLQSTDVIDEEYLMANFTLHNISFVNCTPITKVLNGSKAGIEARNALQLIYSGYAMMKYMTKLVARGVHTKSMAKQNGS